MHVVGFAGYSGAGKTTLIEQLIPALKARGLRVSVVKHAHHGFDIDHPGKDSYRHREAGAFEVVVASSRRLALVREYEAEQEPSVAMLIAELRRDVDWVLVEGFKHDDIPRIELRRAGDPRPPRYPEDARVLAVATDAPAELQPQPLGAVLDLNDVPALVRWLLDNAALFENTP
ncbi:molybdopterin-guanine dinucleotide biosynthesis protein B [Pseudorhodoferax sp. Leaf267]|uniref:molybdopterin-guanine dinucleotide biosynthesis protein B n=1 Tax=Pseudorhodoferax sp. Leaf267 TaxID=1736316 RepID=UPI0006F49F67|nr:molybdopterin-guanine dinucleotide biosynthesis protein B [Pseudorhodoferax sp. Leaf267]KQP21957.1 molybdopterin-guanine dinucleotide biosynthesis protein MobB [Pseudorhodoferax sp. Leaf267]